MLHVAGEGINADNLPAFTSSGRTTPLPKESTISRQPARMYSYCLIWRPMPDSMSLLGQGHTATPKPMLEASHFGLVTAAEANTVLLMRPIIKPGFPG